MGAAERVRESLKALGAPLANTAATAHYDAEATLVEALRLLHQDATLLRVLPVVVFRRAHDWNWDRLKALATDEGLRRRLGMVVELSGWLADDPDLVKRGRSWRAFVKPAATYEYLQSGTSVADRRLATERTPTVAREWGFLVNVSEDALKAFFVKHVE